MGGIPTDRLGRVVVPAGKGSEEALPGLYAAGECACASVHGANRLGGNSLLDILVFGRVAGKDVIDYVREHPFHRDLDGASLDRAMDRLTRWDREGEGVSVYAMRQELTKTMEDHAGVFRTEEIMTEGLAKLRDARSQMGDVRLKDRSKVFNTARIEALELENLLEVGIAIAVSALYRKESRGAHSRPDYPERDDASWMKHSLYFLEEDRIDYKPVRTKPLTVETFPPKERVY
jgi:succinate dehydrogenase / fumarate reductase flavoprotein subunit